MGLLIVRRVAFFCRSQLKVGVRTITSFFLRLYIFHPQQRVFEKNKCALNNPMDKAHGLRTVDVSPVIL